MAPANTWRGLLAGPCVVACIAWLCIVTHIDPAGSYPTSGEGPGLTIDESFNVQQGVLLVTAVWTYGPLLIFPEPRAELFHPQTGLYLADHPPLGRFWLGLHHAAAWTWRPPHDPDGAFVTACARTGSATAFALTILLLGVIAGRWWGLKAGWLAAVTYALIPRVYGHAHLAALESFTNLTGTLAAVALLAWWTGPALPTRRQTLLSGIGYGLFLLTKIQAVFLPIPFALWMLIRWRMKAILPLALWD